MIRQLYSHKQSLIFRLSYITQFLLQQPINNVIRHSPNVTRMKSCSPSLSSRDGLKTPFWYVSVLSGSQENFGRTRPGRGLKTKSLRPQRLV